MMLCPNKLIYINCKHKIQSSIFSIKLKFYFNAFNACCLIFPKIQDFKHFLPSSVQSERPKFSMPKYEIDLAHNVAQFMPWKSLGLSSQFSLANRSKIILMSFLWISWRYSSILFIMAFFPMCMSFSFHFLNRLA